MAPLWPLFYFGSSVMRVLYNHKLERDDILTTVRKGYIIINKNVLASSSRVKLYSMMKDYY